MINRASVPMWGIAGKSAGPPKWAGKKSDTRPGLQLWRHGSDFIYTKNFARPGFDFIYTKNSARPGSDFIYTKNRWGRSWRKWPFSLRKTRCWFLSIYLRNLLRKRYVFEKFSRCAGNLFIVILSTQRIPGGDLVENHYFTEVKLADVCRF